MQYSNNALLLMETTSEPRSKLYKLDAIEADDELDLELAKLYADHCAFARNKSEIELHNYLQDRASQNKKEYNDVVSALLYGVLTEPESARMFFQSITSVNRDHYSIVISKLQAIVVSIKFQLLRMPVREQIFWLINELSNLGAPNVDILYLCLLRQIRGGDLSQMNLMLCDQVLRLCELQKSWLDVNHKVMATAVYTYLRIISDHRSTQLQALQQKEIRFVIALLREKWMLCVPIGRDLIRVLHDLATIPEFAHFWDDLLNNPQRLSPKFKGIPSVLKTPTPREFLKCRLTPDIEFKLLYILQNLSSNHYQRNLNWFVMRYLNTPEAESFYVDVVRYLVAGWYPSNQILQSDIVPRYVVIGSMLRSIKSNIVAANVKTALIYDWLFFTPTDNIMFIEPAMLLMERSAERYPAITAFMMEFLKHSVDKYFPPLKDYMAQCVACGMRVLLAKGVIRSLIPIYRCPATEPATREYMQALFSEFLVEDSQQQQQQQQQNYQPPSLPASVSMHASSYVAETSNPIRTEQADLSSEEEGEEDMDYNRSTAPPSVAVKEEDDVDAYLYGDSETRKPAEAAAKEEEEDDEDDEMGAVVKEEEVPLTRAPSTPMRPQSAQSEGEQEAAMDTDEEQMATDDDYYEEDEEEPAAEGLQTNQSYWIFGDSLKRFKEACKTVREAQKTGDLDEYNVQILIAKRSLREILAVFLRMAIPAEALAKTIGSHIRNMVAFNLLTHRTTPLESDDDSILTDSTKDIFDLVMATFWSGCKNDASREKMMRLIGCIACNGTVERRRHIIGMRWWEFIAVQLQNDTEDTEGWFQNILKNYDTYVMHAYTIEESTMDQNEYLKAYLKRDLEMLAEQDATFFNILIPLLYENLPKVTTGNMDLLRLVVLTLLPDTMSKLVCGLHYGSISVFGDNIDVFFLQESLNLPVYETVCCWQLLAAELQGKSTQIEEFFQIPDIVGMLKTNFKSEIVPSLFSILTSMPTSKDLLYAIISIVPNQHKMTQPQVQFVLASLQFWSMHTTDVFLSSLHDLVAWIKDQIKTEEAQPEATETLLVMLELWWKQKSAPVVFKGDKQLLTNLYKLGTLVGYSCPTEWNSETSTRKKKRSILPDSDSDE